MTDPKIVVIGDVMLDRYIEGRIERYSDEAHVPVFDYRYATDCPGGAANVAANVKALGGQPMLVSGVGADDTAADLTALLQTMAIPNRMPVLRDRQTTLKTRYCIDGRQVFRADRETRDQVSDADDRKIRSVAVDAVEDADALIISDYEKGVVTNDLVKAALHAAFIKGIPIIVDARGDYWRFNGVSVIKPNLAEFKRALAEEFHDVNLSVSNDFHRMAGEFLRVGCAAVVVTLGGDGMVVSWGDRDKGGRATVNIPAHYREVADVVGAGDTVAAALAVYMARGYAVPQAAVFANAAAAVVVGKRGTATATREEVEATLGHPGDRLQTDRSAHPAVAG